MSDNTGNDFIGTAKAVKNILSRQTDKQHFSWRKLNIIFSGLKQHRGLAFWGVLFTLAASAVTLPAPMITSIIIDKYIPVKNIRMILLLTGASLGIYLLNLVFNTILNYIFTMLNNHLVVSIKNSLFEKIVSLPLSFFSKNHSNYVTSRLNEVNQLDSVFSTSLMSLIVSLLNFIFSFVILAFISWKILLMTVCILPFQYLLVRKFTGGIRNVSREAMEKNAELSSDIQEVVAGISTVKSFSNEKKESRKIQNSILSAARTSILQKIIYSLSRDIIEFITHASGLVIFLACMLLIVQGEFTVGIYIACTQYVFQVLMPVQFFASMGIILQPMAAAVNRINEYFEMFGEHEDKQRKYRPKKINGGIQFRKVSFSYGDIPVFSRLSFSIRSGDRVAILGANGSGKTTLLKLMLQLELPQSGSILLDDTDLGTYDLSNLRKKTGFVSQEVFLFNDTIKNNILYGNESCSEEELEDIIRGYAGFINEFPEGLDTQVGEKGCNLSGGQRQTVSILRTILKHPDIFIFDEGSSNLDRAAYERLMVLIDRYFQGKTCIFVSHDPGILAHVDRILYIGDKTISEKSKEELQTL